MWTCLGKFVNFARKSAFTISNLAKFESDLLKTNQDIASSSFTDVYMVGGRTNSPPPPTMQTSVNFHNFAELYLHSFTTCHFKT